MDITLGEFQELWKVNKSDMDENDKRTEMVAILSGKTSNEVDTLSIPEFKSIENNVVKILEQPLPEAKAQRTINGIGISYEPGKLSRGQYVTVMHFMKGDPIDNCHLIMASLSYNPKTKKHEADKHSEIAEKLQEAKFIEIYAACLFFSQLFTASIKGLESYFLREMIMKGMNPTEAMKSLTVLMKGLDGCLMPNRLQTLRA